MGPRAFPLIFLAVFLAAVVALGAGAASGALRPEAPPVAAAPPIAVRIITRLAGAGVRCEAMHATRPSYPGELSEAHCRDYALATFTSSGDRAAWFRHRRSEPWLPARWIVLATGWTAWTSSALVAADVARVGHGIRLRASLPAPYAHISRLCDLSRSGCSLPLARPVPMSPSGFVYAFTSEAWDTSITDTETGLWVVTASAPETAALTGIVESSNGPVARRGPIAGLRLHLRSADPRMPPLTLTTTTDRWGAFAFTDVPAAADGSCYLITAHARDLVTIVYATLFNRNQQDQVTWEISEPPLIKHSDSDRCAALITP